MMKQWLQRFMISTVAVLTLGAITPNHEIWETFQSKDKPNESNSAAEGAEYSIELARSSGISSVEVDFQDKTGEEELLQMARQLSYEKFGTRIGPVIQDEFDSVIFPRIEAIIQTTIADAADRRLAITEKPSGAYAEKIFHVYDQTAEQDLIRFHVRTEKRPQDGYFYNFHYHTFEDGFVNHYTLGDIHWSKNTPPKWLS